MSASDERDIPALRGEIESLRAQLETMSQRLAAIELRSQQDSTPASSANEDKPDAEPAPPTGAADPPVLQNLVERAREFRGLAPGTGQSAPPESDARVAQPLTADPAGTPSPGKGSAARSPARVPPVAPDLASPVPSPKPASRDVGGIGSLEWLLGARGLALGGVIILVVGIGTFLKIAYDEGWITVSPMGRCIAAAVLGVALIGAGEFLRRRINPLASSGVTAAGIVSLYLAVLAAARLYTLIDSATAFVLLVAITVGGVLLGAFSRRVMLALLSLIGAYLAPIILATGEPSAVVMPAYLACLMALGLVLAGWLGGAYTWVRRLAWWGTTGIGTLWAIATVEDAFASVLVFTGVVWAMTVSELIVSARFFDRLRSGSALSEQSQAGFVVDERGEVVFRPEALFTPGSIWMQSAFGSAIWAVVLGGWAIGTEDQGLVYLAPLLVGTASVTAAIFALPAPAGGRWIFVHDASPRSALAASLAMIGTLLGAVAIGVGLGGTAQVLTWFGVGLAAIEVARRLRFRALNAFGIALIASGCIRLGLIDITPHLDGELELLLADWWATVWNAQVVVGAAVLWLGAWRTRYGEERLVLSCVGLWAFASAVVHQHISPMQASVWFTAIAAAWSWVCFAPPIRRGFNAIDRPALAVNALVLAGLGTLVSLGAHISLSDAGAFLAVDLSVLALVTAAWVAIALLPGLGYAGRSVAGGVISAMIVIACVSLQPQHGIEFSLAATSIAGVLVVFLSGVLRRWSACEFGVALLLLPLLSWLVIAPARSKELVEAVPFTHAVSLTSFVAIAGLVYAWRIAPRLPIDLDAPRSLGLFRVWVATLSSRVASVVLFAWSSLEVVRGARIVFEDTTYRGAALSAWWSVFAVSCVWIGLRGIRSIRWVGLALLLITAGKVLVLDTMTLSAPARVAAAMVVGLVMVTGGVLYARVSKKVASEVEEPNPTD